MRLPPSPAVLSLYAGNVRSQHPWYGNAISSIGKYHEAQGERWTRRWRLYAQAGEVFQATFGKDSVQCAIVNCAAASVHIKKGELDCALQLLQGALLVLEVPLPYPSTHCWLYLTTGLCRRQWVRKLNTFALRLSASLSCTRRRASWTMRSTGCQRCSLCRMHSTERVQRMWCR